MGDMSGRLTAAQTFQGKGGATITCTPEPGGEKMRADLTQPLDDGSVTHTISPEAGKGSVTTVQPNGKRETHSLGEKGSDPIIQQKVARAIDTAQGICRVKMQSLTP